MLERLVLKNAAECTSQRLKWTSGAQVMIISVAQMDVWISTLKNRICLIYLIFLTLQNLFICLDLSLGSMLDSLVWKNAVECTSQPLKWTSGAPVMTVVHAWLDVRR